MKVSKDLRKHIDAAVRAKAEPALREIKALVAAEKAKATKFHERLEAIAEPARRRIAAEVAKAFEGGDFRMVYGRKYSEYVFLPPVRGENDYATPALGRLNDREGSIYGRISDRISEIVVALELGGTADDLERMISETSFAKFRPGFPGRPVHPRRKGGAE